MQMLMFHKNLNYLRLSKGLKLAEMPDSIGFARSTWSGYELGNSFPNFKDLIKISEFFGVSESDLIHADLSKGKLIENVNSEIFDQKGKGNGKGNGKLNANYPTKTTPAEGLVKEPLNPYKAPRMPAVVTVDSTGADNIVFVPVKAQAGYLIGYQDPEYIEQLPTFHMPGLRNGTFRMFEAEGLSMAPTLSATDKVICEWVPYLSQIAENRIHVVVTTSGVLIKRVLNRLDQRDKIYLKSDTITYRAEHPIIEIDPSEILEIWYVRLRVSSNLSEPSELHQRVSDIEINQREIMRRLGLK